MRSKLIYDLPTRIFHWLFAGLFLSSYLIASLVDDESALFSIHMILGILMSVMIIWRLIWGIVGSKYARFKNFKLTLTELKNYFLGILNGSNARWAGHNPASSWATMIMILSGLALTYSGYLMITGYGETFEDLHELFANIILITALLHVAGVILHSFRHRDGIGFSMIDGKKDLPSSEQEISSSRPFAALFIVSMMSLSTYLLLINYNFGNGTLSLFGKSYNLGEVEKGNGNNEHGDDDD